jgi:D-arabinose 1-dehydrogenase-like Zn-dependent alcohol dehydrogenase
MFKTVSVAGHFSFTSLGEAEVTAMLELMRLHTVNPTIQEQRDLKKKVTQAWEHTHNLLCLLPCAVWT